MRRFGASFGLRSNFTILVAGSDLWQFHE